MSLKSELIAVAIRLAEEKRIIPQTDVFTDMFATMFGGETRNQRLAREIEQSFDKMTDATKQIKIGRIRRNTTYPYSKEN